jgi:uracil-DNA glycosylase
MEQPNKNFEEFKTAVLQCKKCQLATGRTNVVPGEGNERAEVMFIGEGPGKNEDLQGRPFIGAAGKFLDQMLDSVKLKREDVYIANIIKCRPPENRDPLPEEASACWPWLEKQIELIEPLIIVLLGRHSTTRFLANAVISKDHGQPFRKKFGENKIIFYPCYHPAAALYNGGLRETLLKDFQKIPKIIEIAKKDKKAEEEISIDKNQKNKQGKLF